MVGFSHAISAFSLGGKGDISRYSAFMLPLFFSLFIDMLDYGIWHMRQRELQMIADVGAFMGASHRDITAPQDQLALIRDRVRKIGYRDADISIDIEKAVATDPASGQVIDTIRVSMSRPTTGLLDHLWPTSAPHHLASSEAWLSEAGDVKFLRLEQTLHTHTMVSQHRTLSR